MQWMIAVAALAAVLGFLAPDAGAAAGPVARWVMDAGAGPVVRDTTGSGHDARIVGAAWVREGGRPELRFRGKGAYLDVASGAALKIAGDKTIVAWLRLDASPYPDDDTNWAVVDCEDYRRSGFILRVDGGSARVVFRSSSVGGDRYVWGGAALANRTTHCVAVVCRGNTATLYVNGLPDASGGTIPASAGDVPFRISAPTQSFDGAMREVAIYDRALDGDEIADAYWRGAAAYLDHTARRDTLGVRPFVYYDEAQVAVEVDFLGVMPLRPGERVVVELAGPDGKPRASRAFDRAPAVGRAEVVFPLQNVPPGSCAVTARLEGGRAAAAARAAFPVPEPRHAPPAVARDRVGPLPAAARAPRFEVRQAPGGGALLTVRGRTYAIGSTFTMSGGVHDALTPGPASHRSGGWAVRTQVRENGGRLRGATVEARGAAAAIHREMRVEPGRITFRDTLTNHGSRAIGIVFENRVAPTSGSTARAFLAGRETTTAVSDREIRLCPAIQMCAPGYGVGLVALDDVTIVQARGAFDPARGIGIGSRELALDAGASCTLEWAVYVTPAGDFFDLANAVRRTERPTRMTVEGGLTMVPDSMRRRDPSLVPQSQRFYDIRNLRYVTSACLSWCADDPEVSLEGIEFIERPKERRQVRAVMDALAAVRPGVMGMFHVAHQLYATNRPDALFPDSRVIDASGQQTVYATDYLTGSYFSRRRVDENWRWWIYYPTLENSFGKALLASVDVMMGEMGTRGVFADGFLIGYGGLYTYDRWDGRSADLDPATAEIQRKKGSVLLLTQGAMEAWVNKIRSRGGVVIANGMTPTRSMSRLRVITDKEITEGPDVLFQPTPVTLGNPSSCQTPEEMHRDVLAKLRWGNLYFYYGEPADMRYETLPARMYPITVRSTESGVVRGDERIVTMRSGVYGWPGSRALHVAYRFDARGRRVTPRFLTTADASGVRTRAELEEGGSAVIEQAPIRIECDRPVNLSAQPDGPGVLAVQMNGTGVVRLLLPGGRRMQYTLRGARTVRVPCPGVR